MIANFSDTLRQYANGWIILALLTLEVLFSAVILPRTLSQLEAESGGTGPIDLLFFYTPHKAYSMIASYGEAGRATYSMFELTTDIVHPVIYALFFSLLVSWLFQRSFANNNRLRGLIVVPLGALLFDLLENLSIATMLSLYPSMPSALAWVATLFTMMKWSFVGASMVLLLVGIVMAFKNRFQLQQGMENLTAREH